EQGVREAEAGTAAMELRRTVGLQLDPPEVDSVDEPLGHQFRGVRAEQERHEGDLPARVALDRVRLEIVRRPAHRSLRTPAGTSQATTRRYAAPTTQESRKSVTRTPIRM